MIFDQQNLYFDTIIGKIYSYLTSILAQLIIQIHQLEIHLHWKCGSGTSQINFFHFHPSKKKTEVHMQSMY